MSPSLQRNDFLCAFNLLSGEHGVQPLSHPSELCSEEPWCPVQLPGESRDLVSVAFEKPLLRSLGICNCLHGVTFGSKLFFCIGALWLF